MTQEAAPLAPTMNHIFVDYENVQQLDLSLIAAANVKFTLLIGPRQAKLATDLVEKMIEHSSSVNLVRLKSAAKNAVDFALAYYLGRAALADPGACFHIISKDTGYDPLIDHLRGLHIKVRRQSACADLPFTWPGKAASGNDATGKKAVAKKAVKKKTAKKKAATKKAAKKKVPANVALPDEAEKVMKNLREHPKARPAKRKKLMAMVSSLTGEDPQGAESVIAALVRAGKLSFDEKDVPRYKL